MKKASYAQLAFYLLLFTIFLPTTTLFATPPGPPLSDNAPLPALWVLAIAGVALGIQRLKKEYKA